MPELGFIKGVIIGITVLYVISKIFDFIQDLGRLRERMRRRRIEQILKKSSRRNLRNRLLW